MIDDSQQDSNNKNGRDWIYDGTEYHRIPEGKYTASCLRWHKPELIRAFGRKSMRLDFWIHAEEVELAMFINFGNLKPGKAPGPLSKYFQSWVVVNQGLPRRGDRMSPEIFVEHGLLYTVEVQDTKKDSKNLDKPDFAIYSRVEQIVGVTRP